MAIKLWPSHFNILMSNAFINLNEKSIDSLFNNTNILLDNIDKYKKNKIDIEGLYNSILNYNKEIYKSDDEPYIGISYLLQFFEEFYEISNDFLYSIINNYENFDMFLDLCQRWKLRINEITKLTNTNIQYSVRLALPENVP